LLLFVVVVVDGRWLWPRVTSLGSKSETSLKVLVLPAPAYSIGGDLSATKNAPLASDDAGLDYLFIIFRINSRYFVFRGNLLESERKAT
jgi:hypothetical protein